MNSLARRAPKASRKDPSIPTARCGVVVPVYEAGPELERALRSIRTHGSGAPVVAVDDHSPSGPPTWALAEGLVDEIVHSAKNSGFGTSCNRGAAELPSVQYLLFLNQDAELLTAISPALDFLDNHPEIAVVGGLMRGPDGKERSSVLRYPVLRSILFNRFGFVELDEVRSSVNPTGAAVVDYVEGSFLLVRASAWRAVGGMDEEYFMYGEERDLSARLDRAGLGSTVWLPLVEFRHDGGFQAARRPWVVAGQRRFLLTHRTGTARLLLWAALLAKCALTLALASMKALLGRPSSIEHKVLRQALRAAVRGDGR